MLLLTVLAVVLLDQGVKHWVRQGLADRSLSLGALGTLRPVQARMWLARVRGRAGGAMVWTLWSVAALCLVGVVAMLPSAALPAGLLLGGALSHAGEHMTRGQITDYICLRFWPAFNLADVAITLGSAGLLWLVWRVIAGGAA